MSGIVPIEGSVCAPQGYRAAGVAAGIKPSGNRDVALIVSDHLAAAAAVFTQNRVCGAPVQVSRAHVAGGQIRAVAVNAGCSNVCTGTRGLEDARRMAALAAELVSTDSDRVLPDHILVASTGVIGRFLPMERVEAGLRSAAAALAPDGDANAALAIMTTDTYPKEAAVEVSVAGGRFRIGGICKGSGMIAPNMATMLAFVTTDAEVNSALLQELLEKVADRTFNCVTVDGDTSTSDTLAVLANGRSGVRIEPGTPEEDAFGAGLEEVCRRLSRELARDGEGATKLVEVRVTGARSEAEAHIAAKAIANSLLVKTALFGNDPNWGRILCAAGYAGVDLDPNRTALTLCGISLVRDGTPVPFDEPTASRAMQEKEIGLILDLGAGAGAASVWTCDLSYDYVKINAEYTT